LRFRFEQGSKSAVTSSGLRSPEACERLLQGRLLEVPVLLQTVAVEEPQGTEGLVEGGEVDLAVREMPLVGLEITDPHLLQRLRHEGANRRSQPT
jgi:hypothetical protein